MTRGAYYNDADLFVCEWLRRLIGAGHLPAGDVDERKIEDVSPTTSAATRSVTFSLASADGPLRSDSPVGPTIDLFGQAVAPASRSAPPARSVAAQMSATYGLRSGASSASVALQQSLASRLQERLVLHGWTMFALTWSLKATPLRRPICRLHASALRTSGNDCGGWPTPMAGWPTTTAGDAASSRNATATRYRTPPTGVHAGLTLLDAATYAAWPTPKAGDSDKGVRTMRGAQKELARKGPGADLPTLAASAWATPNARDFKVGSKQTYAEREGRPCGDSLSNQAAANLSGWALPIAADSRGSPGATEKHELTAQVRGLNSNGSPAETASTGQLNPAFSRWLMGYPAAWDACAPTVTPSSRKSRPNSSGQS